MSLLVAAAAQQGIASTLLAGFTPANKPYTQALFECFDGAQHLTLDGASNVSQWDDLSGNVRHATQGTATDRPAYEATDARAGNIPTVGHVGSSGNEQLVTPAFTGAKRLYVVAFYKSGTDTSFDTFNRLISFADEIEGLSGQINTADLNVQSPLPDVQINAASGTSTLLPLPRSVLVAEYATARGNTTAHLLNRPAGARPWDGGAQAFCITDGSESSADAERIAGYLAHRAGIQSDLPSGHPYRSAPP